MQKIIVVILVHSDCFSILFPALLSIVNTKIVKLNSLLFHKPKLFILKMRGGYFCRQNKYIYYICIYMYYLQTKQVHILYLYMYYLQTKQVHILYLYIPICIYTIFVYILFASVY